MEARAPPPLGAALGSEAAAGEASSSNAECFFKDGLDYVGSGEEEVVEHATPELCCSLCIARNARNPGACAVAVLSSESDRPPRACWLKSYVGRAVPKEGVRACWPPGHQAIPPDPGTAETAEARDHEAFLKESYTVPAFDGSRPDAETLRKRADAIRAAMRHAWDGYRKLAWGKDELMPISGRGVDKRFNHAVTMVDALDTLWIMGLKEEFNEAKEWLAQHMPDRIRRIGSGASLFETTIRSLGGLLAAYDLSREVVFLELAKQLGARINEKVSANGIAPYSFGGGMGGMRCHSLAESGTIQLEMRYLSHVTGDPSYSAKVDQFYRDVRSKASVDGLWANCYQSAKGKITFGADGDSFYEYLVKVWLQGGQQDDELWQMYDKAADGMEKHLVKKGSDGLTYMGIGQWSGRSDVGYIQEMEHLTCFVPGWLALGATTERGKASREHRMELAAAIAYTCWQMYEQQPTGISPERVKQMTMDLSKTDTREYILRPEAMEGWWYMSELTDDPRYREWGWQAFLSFEKWLWVKNGYASLKDVRKTQKQYLDRMESFWLAETLKYAFLLQDPDNKIKLDRYVFNTEAHPLSILEFAPTPVSGTARE